MKKHFRFQSSFSLKAMVLFLSLSLLCMGGGSNVLMGQPPVMWYDTIPPAVSNTMFESPLIINDDYGNSYSLSDVTRPANRMWLNTCDIAAGDGVLFNVELDFFDAEGLEDGFTTIAEAQSVVCQVFSDIAHLLVASPTCLDVPPTLRIKVLAFSEGPTTAGINLGRARAFHYNFTTPMMTKPGITHSSVWRTINGGEDPTSFPYVIGTDTYYHGEIGMNFHETLEWNYDLNETGGLTGPDFYTVVLHEVGHLLGIASLINGDGNSKFDDNVYIPSNTGLYSRFDKYLYALPAIDNSPLIDNFDNCYSTGFNSGLLMSLSGGCNAIHFNYNIADNLPTTFTPPLSLPIFAPNPYLSGSSLSHFGDSYANCGVVNPYVMKAKMENFTPNRIFTDEEMMVLCALGYRISGNYGNGDYPSFHTSELEECGNIAAGVDDDGANCHDQYIFSACDIIDEIPLIIPFSDIMENDIGVITDLDLSFDPDLLCIDPIVGNIVFSISATEISITNASIGLNVLSYIPISEVTGEQANTTFIYFHVMPCFRCENQQQCNHICNPTLINGCPGDTIYGLPMFPPMVPNTPLLANWLENCPQFDGWYPCAGSVDYFSTSTPLSPSNGVIGLNFQVFASEIAATNILPLEEDTKYILSFYRKAAQIYYFYNDNVEELQINIFHDTDNCQSLPGQTAYFEENIADDMWRQAIGCFTSEEAFNMLLVTGGIPSASVVESAYLLIDDFVLVEDVFPLTEDTTEISIECCSLTTIVADSCQIVPNIYYEWEVFIDTLNEWVLIPDENDPSYTTPIICDSLAQYRVTRLINTETPDFPIVGDYECIIRTAYYNVITNCCPPAPIADFTAPPQIVCIHDDPFFLNPSPEGGVWGGTAVIDTINHTFDPAENGPGTFSIIYTVPNSQEDCPAGSATAYVTVVEPTATIIPGDLVICLGEQDTLTASGGITYSWSNSDTTASILVSPIVTTTYTVTVTDSNGCTATDEATVTVNDLPIADAGTDQTICEGDSVTLTATGGISYEWSTGDSTAIITVTPDSTTIYVVTVTNANDCTATDEVTVTVNDLPIANAGNDQTICEGVSVNLTATGGISYEWSTGDSTAIITVTPDSTTIYIVTVTAENGCTATDDVTVTVNELPIADAGNDNAICLGDTIMLTATGGNTYEWNSGSLDSTITVSPADTTTYSVTVTDVNGCTASDEVTITVNPLPDMPDIENLLPQYCLYDTVQLSPMPSGGVLTVIYPDNNEVVIDDSTYNFIVGMEGVYLIFYEISNEWGCTATFSEVTTVEFCCLPMHIEEINNNFTLECCLDTIGFTLQPGMLQVTNNETTDDRPAYVVPANATWTPTSNDFVTLGLVSSGDPVLLDVDIVVPAGVSLTLQNMRMIFSPNTRILVRKGARLSLLSIQGNTHLSGLCNSVWQGIQVEGPGYLGGQRGFDTGTGFDNFGVVAAKNDVLIEDAIIGIATQNLPIMDVYNIGLQFDNNAIFNPQNSTLYPTLTAVLLTDYINHSNAVATSGGVCIVNGSRVTFYNCFHGINLSWFNNIDIGQPRTALDLARFVSDGLKYPFSYLFTMPRTEAGVYMLNYQAVEIGNPANTVGNGFTGLKYGIRAENCSNVVIYNNQMDFCTVGISAASADINPVSSQYKVVNNQINNSRVAMQFSGTSMSVIQNGINTAPNSLGLIGIFVRGCLYNIENQNIINNNQFGCILMNTGSDPNRVKNNDFNSNAVGVWAFGDNGSLGVGGVQITCNRFDLGAIAIATQDYVVNGTLQTVGSLDDQGLCNQFAQNPADNVFNPIPGLPTIFTDIIALQTGGVFTYFHRADIPTVARFVPTITGNVTNSLCSPPDSPEENCENRDLLSDNEIRGMDVTSHLNYEMLRKARFYEEEGDTTAAINLLQSVNNDFAQRLLLQKYMEQSDTAMVNATLAALPATTPDQQHFRKTAEIQWALKSQNRTYLQLTPQEETDLRDIATAYSPSAHHAQTMLLIARGEEYPAVLPDFPAFLDTALLQQLMIENINFKTTLPGDEEFAFGKVYPNPASDEVCMTYRLAGNRQAEFVLYDFSGMLLQTRQLTGNGLMRFQTHGLPQGIYFYHIKVDGKPISYHKLVIVK